MSFQTISVNVPTNANVTINVMPRRPWYNQPQPSYCQPSYCHPSYCQPSYYQPPTCRRCGHLSHNISNCWAKRDVCGYILQPLLY